MYGWTPEQIENMSPFRQQAMLGMYHGSNTEDDDKTITFNTYREYQDWLSKKRNG